MTLKNKSLVDNRVMRLLKLDRVSEIVAHTNKGTLSLSLERGGSENDYRFYLDSVRCDDVLNNELLATYKGTLYE